MADDLPFSRGEWAQSQLELLDSGQTVYGTVGSPRYTARRQELVAEIEAAAELGEIQPPTPINKETVLARRYEAAGTKQAAEFAATLSENVVQYVDRALAALGALSPEQLAEHKVDVAKDIERVDNTGVSRPYRGYQSTLGRSATGNEIVAKLEAEARVAIQATLKPTLGAKAAKLAAADRNLLETFAARGRAILADREARQKHRIAS